MARAKKLIGELKERAAFLIEEGKPRGEICKSLGISYKQLADEFGNVWKQRPGSIAGPTSDAANQDGPNMPEAA